jgi:hypothetical protein
MSHYDVIERKSTSINRSQPKEAGMQREMPIVSVTPTTKTNVAEELIALCDSPMEAVKLCIKKGNLPSEMVRKGLGYDKAYWSRMMNENASFPFNELDRLMDLCGNRAPIQWLARSQGCYLHEDTKAKRIAELKEELRSLAA